MASSSGSSSSSVSGGIQQRIVGAGIARIAAGGRDTRSLASKVIGMRGSGTERGV